MNIWLLVGLLVAFVACLLLGPVLIAFWRNVRMISHANTPEFRLSMPNLWTEIQTVEGGGSSQMMRMKDGNIVFLSVGLDTAKVFVAPQLDSPASFAEIASFPISPSSDSRRQQEAGVLNQLRQKIGWPNSVGELRKTMEAVNSLL